MLITLNVETKAYFSHQFCSLYCLYPYSLSIYSSPQYSVLSLCYQIFIHWFSVQLKCLLEFCWNFFFLILHLFLANILIFGERLWNLILCSTLSMKNQFLFLSVFHSINHFSNSMLVLISIEFAFFSPTRWTAHYARGLVSAEYFSAIISEPFPPSPEW